MRVRRFRRSFVLATAVVVAGYAAIAPRAEAQLERTSTISPVTINSCGPILD